MLAVGEGVRLQYLDWGGSGETVVLLPGLGNTAYIYTDFAPRLAARGFRPVALTRRGHGRSSQPAGGYEPDSLANDIRVLLDTLGVPRAHVVGHSFAGVEMTRFATRHPDRLGKLVYLDAAYDRQMQFASERPDPSSPPRPSAEDRASWESLLAFFRRPDHYYGRVWSAATEADIRERHAPDPDGRLQDRTPGRVYGAIIATATQSPPDYSGIRAPVLSYYALATTEELLPPDAPAARRDSARAYEREVIQPWTRASIGQLRSALPAARIVELPGTYHHHFIQHLERTADEVAAFLRSR
jgi:pimeloyl-ACP methyl ester carboxylesterase